MSVKLLITGVSCTGKCQPINTLIPTPIGYRLLGDIKEGDSVFTISGRETEVIGVYPQGIKSCYKITFSDGTTTECSEDHIWRVTYSSHGKKKTKDLTLKEILAKGYKKNTSYPCKHKYYIPLTQPVQYSEKDLSIHPYILGVLIGDGSLTTKSLILTSYIEDSFIVNKCRTIDDTIFISEKYTNNKIINTISRKHPINKHINDLGLSVYSKNRFIPNQYKFSSIEQRKELLAGLLDTDGSQSARNNSTSFSTVSETLAYDVRDLVLSLGGIAKVHRYVRTDKQNKVEFHITIKLSFCPFSLPRKANKWSIRTKNSITRAITNIERIQDTEQVCIQVKDNSQLYLTNDYIVTHNTSTLGTLKNAFVVSRDGKPFSLNLPHTNIPDYDSMKDFMDIVESKLEKYVEKFGKSPDTIVFDSVSRIFSDIETYCSKRFQGFDVWSNLNKEINIFLSMITDLQNAGFNIVLIAHSVWDENARKYIETCKGSFAKIGGWLSTVDYAINLEIVGNKRIVHLKNNGLSRTLLDGLPDKMSIDEFNLQDYIDKINIRSSQVTEQWSI